MTPRWSHLLVLVALAVAFAAGRHTARPAEETHEEVREDQIAVTTDEATEAEEIAEHAVTKEATERTEATTERIRVVYRERIVQADGATAEREMELGAETAHLLREVEARREEVATLRALLASERSSEALLRASLDLRRHVKAPAKWMLGPAVAADTRDGTLAYGLQGSVRLAGPLHFAASAVFPGLDRPTIQGALLVEF